MSRQVALFLFLFLLSACGGGEEKRAFADYEAAVDPLLEEEARLNDRFREISSDAFHFGANKELGTFIRKTLAPFYARMERGMEKVQPSGERLREIHRYLLDYVKLRREFLVVFGEMEALDARSEAQTKDLRDRIRKLGREVEEKGQAIQPAFEAAPEDGQRILETLHQISTLAANTQQSLQALEAGGIPADRYLAFVGQKVLPFLETTKKNLAELSVSDAGRPLIRAVLDYLRAMEELVGASRPLAEARREVETAGGPIQQRLTRKLAAADATFKTYREEARRYRDSLR